MWSGVEVLQIIVFPLMKYLIGLYFLHNSWNIFKVGNPSGKIFLKYLAYRECNHRNVIQEIQGNLNTYEFGPLFRCTSIHALDFENILTSIFPVKVV